MIEQKTIENQIEEINFLELFSEIWNKKWLVIIVTVLFSLTSIIYSLTLPNVYKSEVTLAPVSDDSSLRLPGQLGGLAALAGVNLGGLGNGDKTGITLEILKSRDFMGKFIEYNDLFVPIMASKGWDIHSGELIIDPQKFNIETQEWVRKVKPPYKQKPSISETLEEFQKLFSVNQDKSTGMIRISVKHHSPLIAKSWADKLVISINEEMRARELNEANKSIDYLSTQISLTNIADVQAMLYSLIEEQTKTVMLANVRDEYILQTVDPAIIPEKKSGPKRFIIVFLTTVLGFIFGFITVLIVIFFKNLRN